MANGGFSISVSNRGHDFMIGGSGILDADGMTALRQAVEESCKNEGATVLLDLTGLTEFQAVVVAALVDTGDFCRGLGVPLTLSVSPAVLRVLNDAGYSDELLPL
ncbi:MAG: STAS domain-containing protein [Actinomycetota bacterium]